MTAVKPGVPPQIAKVAVEKAKQIRDEVGMVRHGKRAQQGGTYSSGHYSSRTPLRIFFFIYAGREHVQLATWLRNGERRRSPFARALSGYQLASAKITPACHGHFMEDARHGGAILKLSLITPEPSLTIVTSINVGGTPFTS